MWSQKDNALEQRFQFKDFKTAFAFMTEVAFHAESMNHHPNWSNVYHTVNIRLTTHDAGNTITEKDHKLAKLISRIYFKHQ